jgi:hypothetical protein
MASDPKGLGAKFDAHTDAEFNTRGLVATMGPPMGTLPHVTPRADHDRKRGV